MNRGDHREPIFNDDFDRRRFLESLDRSLRQNFVASPCLLSHE
jgi:hypothetical protein